MAGGRILRLGADDADAKPPVAPTRILRGAERDTPEDAPEGRRMSVIRSIDARSAEPYDVALETLRPDFPLPSTKGEAAEDVHPSDPDHIRAAVESEWKKKLEDTVMRVREEAFEAGYGRARAEMKDAADMALQELREDARRMKQAIDDVTQSMQPKAVALALTAAETLLGCPLSERARTEAERALASAVEKLTGDGPIDVSMHPVDLLRIQESGLDAQLSSALPGLRWHPDDTLEEGDWSARSSQAVIRRIQSEMVDAIRTRLGVDGAEPADS